MSSTEKYKVPLLDSYQVQLDEGIYILDTKDFLSFLKYEVQSDFSTTIKSKFIYIVTYFSNRPFNRSNFRIMLGELREGITGIPDKSPINYETANKYVMVGGYIADYLKLDCLDKYPRFKKDEKSKSKGDLISDDAMRQISECYINHGIEGGEIDNEKNLLYNTAITIMRFTGMPPDDLVDLRWEDDKLTHFELMRNKTGLDRKVPIVAPMRVLLDKLPRYKHGYIIAFEKGPVIEKTIRDEIQRRAKKLGMKEWITSYSFRYSMITACLLNAGEGMIPSIAHISGHSIGTAMKHYNKHNVGHLTDVLMATHPGLRKDQSIDNVKRLVFAFLSKLLDLTKFEIELTIRPKPHDERNMKIS